MQATRGVEQDHVHCFSFASAMAAVTISSGFMSGVEAKHGMSSCRASVVSWSVRQGSMRRPAREYGRILRLRSKLAILADEVMFKA